MDAVTIPTRHRFYLPPLMLLILAVALGVGLIMVVTFLARRPPWLGLKLRPAESGAGAVVLASEGPSAEIPEGAVITGVADALHHIGLSRLDLTTEPDGTLGDYATYGRFLERQDRLASIQSSAQVLLTTADGRRFVVHPQLAGRPLTDLPPDFWVQCLVGLIAWLVSVAVFAFRPGEASARYLLLSGASTLLFAPAAAVYTTRELAVSGGLLQWASDLNFLGGSLFTASFVGLLLVYPRRIGPAWLGPAVVALFAGWFVAQQIGIFESMTFARRFLVMLGVAATFALAAWHWRVSARDPLARAKLQWFLLSWVVGTSAFALFILLPQTFGVDTSPIQGYAFSLFLLVYGGLAMGILRYRLFELGDWWRRVIFWVLTVLLLVLLDLFFLFSLQLSKGTSLAAALLVCGLVWIPVRAWLWHRFADWTEGRKASDLFRRVMDVAVTRADPDRARGWRDLMAAVFEPLEIESAPRPDGSGVALHDNGLTLELPAIGPLSGLRLCYARGGRSLFRPRDAALAGELVYMLEHGFKSLDAYREGVLEERGRIARDVHDNIGADLLSALHSPDADSKDVKIRETLADLRQVMNESPDHAASVAEVLADLRVETARRLEAVGMRLCWQLDGLGDSENARPVAHALRSIIREAVSNAIRHSGANELAVSVKPEGDGLRMEMRDDGCGFPVAEAVEGNGLANMRKRLESLHGSLELRSDSRGTVLAACLPFAVN